MTGTPPELGRVNTQLASSDSVTLRFRCCTDWLVEAIVQHCALEPGQTPDARVVFRPGANRCPQCGCTATTWDDPLRVAPATTVTSVAEDWGFLQDRLGREAPR
jgi:hypothetical protein